MFISYKSSAIYLFFIYACFLSTTYWLLIVIDFIFYLVLLVKSIAQATRYIDQLILSIKAKPVIFFNHLAYKYLYIAVHKLMIITRNNRGIQKKGHAFALLRTQSHATMPTTD
jgi:uncharacterized protein YggT (Ycf19 family)